MSFIEEQKSVPYLGHTITPGKLHVAAQTVEAVRGFLPPKTQSDVRSFLGLCNVYRRFVPSFARVAAPLTDLLRKGKPAQLEDFGEKESEAFENLKQLLTSAPVLSLPRDDLPVSIETDASDYQIGVVLMQTHEDGEKHPVGYWSRTLQPAERNYSTTEKECLALVWSCQILRPYLEGRHFTAYTDHQCLRWLLDATDVSGRLARWRLRLSEFTFCSGTGGLPVTRGPSSARQWFGRDGL